MPAAEACEQTEGLTSNIKKVAMQSSGLLKPKISNHQPRFSFNRIPGASSAMDPHRTHPELGA